MDGRDIGTVVLPSADIKVFLTADLATRVQRTTRAFESGLSCLQLVLKRKCGNEPRRCQPSGGTLSRRQMPVVDTTNLNPEEVVSTIVELANNGRRIEQVKGGIAPIYTLSVNIVRAYLQLFRKLKISGQEYVPARGPVIIVANHVSNWDPP